MNPRYGRQMLRCAALGAALACLPATADAATRTWVSGVGDDANPCSRTAPCKTLEGALLKTDEGGEINSIDAGSFSSVVITKAVTIDLSGLPGVILNTATNGIRVNAGADDDVVLRGIAISGGGLGDNCALAPASGIVLNSARSLLIEDVSITRQSVAGLVLAPSASAPSVFVNRVDVTNSCQFGLNAAPSNGQALSVMVRDSTFSRAATGLSASDGARVWITGSTIFANTLGVRTVGSGIINAHCDTQIVGNATDGRPTSTLGCGAAASTSPVAATAPPPPPPSPPPMLPPPRTSAVRAKCTVPNVVGSTLARARSQLSSAGCTLGKVSWRRTTKPARVGRVLAQGRARGAVLAAGTKVAVTVGRRAS